MQPSSGPHPCRSHICHLFAFSIQSFEGDLEGILAMQLNCLYTSPRHFAINRPGPSRRVRQVIVAAKKEKKGGKGAQKKGGGALAELLKKKDEVSQQDAAGAAAFDGLAKPEQYNDPEVVFQLLEICQSYWKQYNE